MSTKLLLSLLGLTAGIHIMATTIDVAESVGIGLQAEAAELARESEILSRMAASARQAAEVTEISAKAVSIAAIGGHKTAKAAAESELEAAKAFLRAREAEVAYYAVIVGVIEEKKQD